jgi:prepilin-type N-terminal cleavage/methylation domain-containing protein
MNLYVRNKGFTLIEIAIVLVVIGILLTIGTGMIGILTKRAKLNENREVVKTVNEAVRGYTAKYKNLPTPYLSTGPNDAYCPSSSGSPTLPQSLGIRVRDAQGKCIVYGIDSALTTGDICCSTSTGLTITGAGSEIAFIVYSSSENYTDDTSATNNGQPPYTVQPPSDIYDDIYEFVSISQLRENLSCSALEIRTTSLTEGMEDFTYNNQVVGFGGCTPYTWGITSGTLPNGVTLCTSDGNPAPACTGKSGGAVTGTINLSGSPAGTLSTCASTSNFTIQVQDAQGKTASKNLSILVYPQTLRITNTDLPSVAQGGIYNTTLYGTGGRDSYSWGISSGSLPPGLTLNPSTGVISGTATTSGTYNFVVQLSDTCTTTSKAFTLTVTSGGGSAPTCTLSASPNPINSGQTTNLTWNITNGPADGTFSPTSGGCTTFSGSTGGNCTTDALSSTTTFTLTVSNAYGSNTCSTVVTVNTLPPTCALSASPGLVRYGETSTLNWSITNGPADGSFSPSSGTCTSFTSSSSGSCSTASLTTSGANTFTLTVTNAAGTSNCSTTLYVGCQAYRVWNNTGATYDFRVDGTCRNNINNNNEITTAALRLNPGETINRYAQNPGACPNGVLATLSYDQAMNADIIVNGGNGNCRVNFTGTDR